MNISRLLIRVLPALLLLIPVSSAAQSNIEKIVRNLDSNRHVTNVMYREKRNPSSHELTSSVRIIQFDDSHTVDRLLEAIKKDSAKATSYTIQDNTQKLVCIITFYDGKSHYTRYVLTGPSQGGEVTFMVRHDYLCPRK